MPQFSSPIAGDAAGCPAGAASLDLSDPVLYSEGDYRSAWEELRGMDRLTWYQVDDRRGFWSVLKYHDADRVLRDPATFTSERGTLTFQLRRKPNKHLAFGVGPHYCVGHTVARVTLRILFTELLTRFTGFEHAAPAARLRSNFVSGYKHMPIVAANR